MPYDALPFLIPVIVLVLIAVAVSYAIVHLKRLDNRLHEIDPGIGTVRRLYFYIVSFAALLMAANGLVQIIRYTSSPCSAATSYRVRRLGWLSECL